MLKLLEKDICFVILVAMGIIAAVTLIYFADRQEDMLRTGMGSQEAFAAFDINSTKVIEMVKAGDINPERIVKILESSRKAEHANRNMLLSFIDLQKSQGELGLTMLLGQIFFLLLYIRARTKKPTNN